MVIKMNGNLIQYVGGKVTWWKNIDVRYKCAIRAINAPLGDFFGGVLLEYSLKKFLKNSLYYFVKVCVKNLPKKCHFQSFPSPFTSHFTI
jgi:hypothetical protein